ncbi:aldo/keto reductase [Bombilactobacillus folatiphilus]|uniref:Aldo/keto reductase n=1 Tax=Bombilactobacillus folatiphilus TaxID=2923362 RepID=A0ABY4PB26_9LACO|nr:aldo/keto reductase [Bombilactobacillus folatiphilus]UQS82924.1 aldo/keto reductase [Bombilactobacillus folatiphilus]
MLESTYQLNNSVQIPRLGFGTWLVDNQNVADAVQSAMEAGYRLIDTAQAYGNEAGIGQALKQTQLNRSELFIATKLAAEIKSYDQAQTAIDKSLTRLGLDYVDLMIIHSPQPWADFRNGEHYFEGNLEAWRALENAYQAGKIKAIGVSNFERVDLQNILDNGHVKPAVNQVLAHVSNTPFELIDFCQQNDILVEAYSPIAHGVVLANPTVQALAHKYQVEPAQLCLRYCLQLGLLPLPKSENPQHIQANTQLDFVINDSDLEQLKQMAPIKDYGAANQFPVYDKGI